MQRIVFVLFIRLDGVETAANTAQSTPIFHTAVVKLPNELNLIELPALDYLREGAPRSKKRTTSALLSARARFV